jgi:hypothetical protein
MGQFSKSAVSHLVLPRHQHLHGAEEACRRRRRCVRSRGRPSRARCSRRHRGKGGRAGRHGGSKALASHVQLGTDGRSCACPAHARKCFVNQGPERGPATNGGARRVGFNGWRAHRPTSSPSFPPPHRILLGPQPLVPRSTTYGRCRSRNVHAVDEMFRANGQVGIGRGAERSTAGLGHSPVSRLACTCVCVCQTLHQLSCNCNSEAFSVHLSSSLSHTPLQTPSMQVPLRHRVTYGTKACLGCPRVPETHCWVASWLTPPRGPCTGCMTSPRWRNLPRPTAAARWGGHAVSGAPVGQSAPACMYPVVHVHATAPLEGRRSCSARTLLPLFFLHPLVGPALAFARGTRTCPAAATGAPVSIGTPSMGALFACGASRLCAELGPVWEFVCVHVCPGVCVCLCNPSTPCVPARSWLSCRCPAVRFTRCQPASTPRMRTPRGA